MKAQLGRHGLPVHKEEKGHQFTSLGWAFDLRPGFMSVEPKLEKLGLVCEATLEAAKRRSPRVEAMQRLVGSW